MKTSKLKFNPNNPRKCSKDKLEKTAAWGHFGIGMPWDA